MAMTTWIICWKRQAICLVRCVACGQYQMFNIKIKILILSFSWLLCKRNKLSLQPLHIINVVNNCFLLHRCTYLYYNDFGVLCSCLTFQWCMSKKTPANPMVSECQLFGFLYLVITNHMICPCGKTPLGGELWFYWNK